MSEFDIGEHYERFVRRMVEERRYENANQVVIEALRNLESRELIVMALEKHLTPEIESAMRGGSRPMDDVVSRLRARYEVGEDDEDDDK